MNLSKRSILPAMLGAAFLQAIVEPPSATAQSLSLATALDSALAHHPSMAQARAARSSAAEGLTEASATRWPSLDMQVGLQRFEEPMVTTPIHGFDPALVPAFNETLVQGTLGLRYTLLDWGRRSSGQSGARAGVAAADANLDATRMELIRTVADAYFGLVAARAVDSAAAARVDAIEAELARARQAFDAGTAAEVEVIRASAAAEDARAARTSTRGTVTFAERSLARVTGLPEGMVADADLVDVARAGGSSVALDEGTPSGTLSGSPVLQVAERRADMARAVADGERSTRLPRLDVTGALHDYGTVSDSHTLEWQAGVQLSWSIFAGGARAARIRRADAEAMAAESGVGAAELKVREAADAARTAVEAADARRVALDSAVEQWEDLVRVETLALEAGAGTQRDVLDAQAGLFQARAGRTQADREAVMARIRLAAARGVLSREWLLELIGESE